MKLLKKALAPVGGLLLVGASSSAFALAHIDEGQSNTYQADPDGLVLAGTAATSADTQFTGDIAFELFAADQGNDEDLFKFTLDVGGEFTAAIATTPSSDDLAIVLVELNTSTGQWLKRAANNPGTSTDLAYTPLAGSSGSFALIVSAFGNNAYSGGGNFYSTSTDGLNWTGMSHGGGATVNGYIINVTGIDDASAVPVPAAVWLFGSGLLGLVGVARRKA